MSAHTSSVFPRTPSTLGERSVWWRRSLLGSMALVAVMVSFGCSRQSEGERCSRENGNDDCDSGLVCTPADDLLSGTQDGVSRCCPSGDSLSDSRCAPRSAGSGTGGSGSGGGPAEGGAAGADGGETPTQGVGDECSYNSDCTEPLVCGPEGRCQVECITDRDCIAPFVCVGSGDVRQCAVPGAAGASG